MILSMVVLIVNESRGTGASAIYPLLACQSEPNWEFVATGVYKQRLSDSFTQCVNLKTDIDDLSVEVARNNVDSNGLCRRIQVIQVDPKDPILSPLSSSRWLP
jgi:23S rRNA (adenine1618-N6)-methyltransferase